MANLDISIRLSREVVSKVVEETGEKNDVLMALGEVLRRVTKQGDGKGQWTVVVAGEETGGGGVVVAEKIDNRNDYLIASLSKPLKPRSNKKV